MNPLHQYKLECLLDGEIALLRGIADGCPPVLVSLAGSAASAGLVQRRLEHEYALLHLLRPEWAAAPLALTRHDGRPALVAADQGGLPLALLLGEPMQTEAFLDVAIAVTDAMAAMHDVGVIHLDIKPAHLLVAPDRQRAWITGFGIAAVAAPGTSYAAASPMLAGTLAYMAPEQAGRGVTAVDARADLYALGVTFYQMLTGTLPLEASEPVAWVHSHLARQPVAPAERNAGIPPVLSAMVMRLQAKAPAERYPSAAALAAELRFCRDAWRTRGNLDALPDSGPAAAQARGASEVRIGDLLAHAVAAGHVVPGDAGNPFAHDRVQEAACSALPAAGCAALHLRLARQLAQRLDRDTGSSLFEMADQFNRGADAIADDDERIEVAALNRDAGQRAMRTTAYGAASAYFAAGERLLPDGAWETHHALALSLAMGRAECEFVSGRPGAAAATLQDLGTRARTSSDLAAITRLRVAVHTALDQPDQAVQLGLAFLRTMGLDFLPQAQGQVEREYRRFLVLLGARPVEALASLPRMCDPAWRATLGVLSEVMSPASFMDRNLRDLIPIWMAIISLEHGNDEASCIAYVQLGMTVGPRLGDYGLGYRLGKVGMALVAQEGMGRFRARVHLCFGALLLPWTQPVRGGRELIERSFEEGRQTGDFNFAAYSRNRLVTHLLACGEPLAHVEAQIDMGLAFACPLDLGRVVDILGAQARYVAVLRGRAPGWAAWGPGAPEPQDIEARLQADPRLAVAACCYWIRKLQACFAVDDCRGALEAAGKAESMLWAAPYFQEIADYHFFTALSLAWLARAEGRPPGSEGAAAMAAFDRHQRQMNAWARENPANFGARAGILAAEASRMARDALQAMRHYEQAARLAREQDLLHDEALAYELCARCCFEQDLGALALAYLRRAGEAYGRWGAEGQVARLDACARTLDAMGLGTDRAHAAPGQHTTYIGPAAQLDLDTAIKATQVLAGEMQLDRLIQALLTTTLQQAAAQRALLFLWQDGALRLAAQARTERAGIAVDLNPAGAAYPRTIVDAALAIRSDFVLDNAKAHARFGQDPDVQLRSVRSVACLVLVKQGELVGLLYLENNLADALFTGRRINLLSLLASQAAISLENARLYAELLRQNQERQRVQAELAHVSRVTTLGELAASIAHEVNQPLTGIVTYGGAGLRWINRPEPDLDEARHAVENMIAEALRASEVIRRIRALARKDDSRRQPFDLGELAAETLSMVRHQAEFHGIAIAQECAPGLPQVLGDRIQLQQVIINLLVNAIQAVSSCGLDQRQLRISTARQADGQVLMRVEDSGPGIGAGQIDKLFEAFYTTRSEGLGMGLSICRSIVEAHGGRIWAESPARAVAPGGQGPGAAFCFTLPARP